MPMTKKKLVPEDLLPAPVYAAKRREIRLGLVARKRLRRIEVGPVATFYFECYETMRQQVQEMLHIEKGGAAQIADELAAYNPLIPQGAELVATLMFEIDDPQRRARTLARLGNIEAHVFLRIGAHEIRGLPEADQDRTNEAGKTSSVHFLHFPFSPAAIADFRRASASAALSVQIGFDHPEYGHIAILPPSMIAELAGDFD